MTSNADSIIDEGARQNMTRLLVFGNSGSGKSAFAKNLQSSKEIAHLDLDTLAWLPDPPPRRKPIKESLVAISDFITANSSWVIEGCYSDLLELVADEANEIVFLNLAVEDCVANALKRPFEPHKFSSAEAQEGNQVLLLQWIRDYSNREDECSYKAHREFFEKFSGKKSEYNSNHDGGE